MSDPDAFRHVGLSGLQESCLGAYLGVGACPGEYGRYTKTVEGLTKAFWKQWTDQNVQ